MGVVVHIIIWLFLADVRSEQQIQMQRNNWIKVLSLAIGNICDDKKNILQFWGKHYFIKNLSVGFYPFDFFRHSRKCRLTTKFIYSTYKEKDSIEKRQYIYRMFLFCSNTFLLLRRNNIKTFLKCILFKNKNHHCILFFCFDYIVWWFVFFFVLEAF